ncbi:hypothetical protein TNCV_3892571 [Trichonephila clavipes]|nr:hypothetical protein TNCV_3892571 [Trichonephila clavipes]
MFYDSGLEIELAILFQTVILHDILNNPSSVMSCIIIHQNEVVTNSSSIWADIWIKDLIDTKTSYGSSMEHKISRRPESLSIVNLDSSVKSQKPIVAASRNMFSCPA